MSHEPGHFFYAGGAVSLRKACYACGFVESMLVTIKSPLIGSSGYA